MGAHRAAPSDRSGDRTPRRPGRITVEESFLDLVDQIAYGDLETWRGIYASALRDVALREAVVRAAGMVGPEYTNAGTLWRTLVGRMPPAAVGRAHVVTSDPGRVGARSEAATREPAG